MPCQFAVSSRRISIHALREEGDLRHQRPCILLQQISIHALREEGDAVTNVNRTHVKDFYPRPPRGGRRLWHSGTKAGRDFYPRPPRGGRLSVLYRPSGRWRISIHALREEGDATFAAAVQDLEKFLSTPSARRATQGFQHPHIPERFLSTPSARRATRAGRHSGRLPAISIHALREEGDDGGRGNAAASTNFYPRPPRGGRHISRSDARKIIQFLSTPSARRATRAERGEGLYIEDFYPRPPRGGRHCQFCEDYEWSKFLSTPSARRATRHYTSAKLQNVISIHALREEGDACGNGRRWSKP